MPLTSPAIVRVAWGRILVEGHDRPLKDAKCFPGGARGWDWNETGTRHDPGVQVDDVRELIDHGAEIVVLATGFHERLQVRDETRAWLDEQDVAYHVLATPEAVQRYNALRQTEHVGGLFHSTC